MGTQLTPTQWKRDSKAAQQAPLTQFTDARKAASAYKPRPMSINCGKMAGWIRKPLITELGLGPGDIVLDGGPSSPF